MTVRRNPSSASSIRRSRRVRSRNAASTVMLSSPGQLFVEVFGNHPRAGEAVIQGEASRANEEAFRDDTGVGTGGQSAGRFFDHLLLLGSEPDDLGQALVAERSIGLKADGVHYDLGGLRER